MTVMDSGLYVLTAYESNLLKFSDTLAMLAYLMISIDLFSLVSSVSNTITAFSSLCPQPQLDLDSANRTQTLGGDFHSRTLLLAVL